jgi:hypothetical protein
MNILWNFETSYVHRIPDFTLTIDDEELEGLSEKEIEEYIEDAVKHAFENQVQYWWRRQS